MSQGKVIALVGAQFGSEAKGVVANHLADQFGVHVRTGGPNAGHTFYYEGDKYVARSVPCGWTNPDAELIIGPGAIIDLDVLQEEIALLEYRGHPICDRLYIDEKAGIITQAHHQGEGGVAGFAHHNIGSTGEGCGLARIARINRKSLLDPDNERYQFEQAGNSQRAAGFGTVEDTTKLVNQKIDEGFNVLLEGTQGSALSLVHGEWPYVTSADTNAGQLAVDAGISPSLVTETLLVCRTTPIRVFGNSGPLPNETTWETLGQSRETTTVTKKVRRVGEWDAETVRKAVLLNRPAKLVLTFLNYIFPNTSEVDYWADFTYEELQWAGERADEVGIPLAAIGTSPWTLVPLPGELEY